MSCAVQTTETFHQFIIFTVVNSHVKETLQKIISYGHSQTESEGWQTTLLQVTSQNETLDESFFEGLNSTAKTCRKVEHQLTVKRSANLLEALIFAKTTVDSSESTMIEFHALSDGKRLSFLCDKLFNSNSYDVKINESACEGIEENFDEDQLSKELISNLTMLPSSDGKPVAPLQSILLDFPGIIHGFTTRQGGISTFSSMKSLNMVFSPMKKDTQVFVEENRKRLAKKMNFDPNKFEMAKSVHGNDVWVTGETKLESYDGIVTNELGMTIAAPGADCPTLLFFDPVKKVVGAAHSGWKGTLANISKNVIRTMETKFQSNPSDVHVAIGPSLSECCFEVDFPLAEQFSIQFSRDFIVRPPGAPRPFVNLWQCITMSLMQEGVLLENIDNGKNPKVNESQRVTQCTKCESNRDKFFSYRRDGKIFGNQCAFIGLRG